MSKIPPSVKVEPVQNYFVRLDAYKSMWPETYPFQELTDVVAKQFSLTFKESWLPSKGPSDSHIKEKGERKT